jgi:hypothetical protein
MRHDETTAKKMIHLLEAYGWSVAADGIPLQEAWREGYDFWFSSDGLTYLPLTQRAQTLQARANAVRLTPEEKLECADSPSASYH